MTKDTTPTSGAADPHEALIYAELPKHAATGLGEEYESFDQNGRPMGKAYQNLVYYTEDQMRAFADATHALRASHGQAPAETGNSVSARADSVQEDASRLDWIAVHGSFGVDSATGEVGGNGQKRIAATRKNIDAARKQGATP